MGAVYLARDRRLEREVAIKLMVVASPASTALFEQEARLLAALESEHVVRIYDFGVTEATTPYLVMEFVRGRTLLALLASGRPTLVEAIRITQGILAGVATAHARGIVHRDLKPSNVFLDGSGRVKVADFGLAYRLDVEDGRRSPGQGACLPGAGTPAYMSPEQKNDAIPGPPGDVFTTGLILHEMLTGRRAIELGDSRGTDSDAWTFIPPPSRLNPAVPGELDTLVLSALALDPAKRPDAVELGRMLGEWLELATAPRVVSGAGIPAHPYKMLSHYEASDRSIFFGRDAEVRELIAALGSPAVRVALLFGPCGVGKSSLLNAGLLPALDSNRFEAIPFVSGPDPARGLVVALSVRARLAGCDVSPRLDDPELAVEERCRLLEELSLDLCRGLGRTLVLVADQLEEVFTLNPDTSVSPVAFLAAVGRLAETHGLPVKLVLGLRTEFRGHFFPLEARLGKRLLSLPVREMGPEGLVEVIEGPSRHAAYGFEFEPGLPRFIAGQIVRATRGAGDVHLPLLQIVCRQLYDRMKALGGNRIDRSLYEDVIGGVEGALGRYAQERLDSPVYPRGAMLARQMLRLLTTRHGGERFSRARDEEEILAFRDREAAFRSLEQLIQDHLVVREELATGGRSVRLASEVLCRLIDGWSVESEEIDRSTAILARSCRQWYEGGRREEDLLDGTALDLVSGQLPGMSLPTPEETVFVEASLLRRKGHQRRRIAGLVAAIGVAMTCVWAVFLRAGELTVESEPPGARVFLDGRAIGETPLSRAVWPGRYELRIEKAPFLPGALSTRIPAGGTTSHRVVMRNPFGVLAVASNPSGAACEVWSRTGRETRVLEAKTPFTSQVPEGMYHLKLQLSGFESKLVTGVNVEGNLKVTSAIASMERDTGQLIVHSPISGARLTVRGTGPGGDPAGTGKVHWSGYLPLSSPVDLPAGRWRLECQASRARATTHEVEITRGAATSWTAWMDVPQRIWAAPTEGAFSAAPALGDLDGDRLDDVVAVTNRQVVHAFRARDGHPLWKARLPGGAEVWSSPALSDLNGDGTPDVVFGADDRRVHARSGRDGEPLWAHDVGAAVPASPLLSDLDGDGAADVAVGTRGGQMVAISGRTGKRLWTGLIGRPIVSSAVGIEIDGCGSVDLVFGAQDAKLHAVCGRMGAPLWTHDAGSPVVASPVAGLLSRDRGVEIAIGTQDGQLRFLSAARGELIGSYKIGASVGEASPVLADLDGDGGLEVLIGDVTGKLHAVSGGSRKPLWIANVGSALDQSAAVVGDLDGTGRPIVVVPDRRRQYVVLDGRTGEFLVAIDGAAGRASPAALLDCDGDGYLDIVRAAGTNVQALSLRWRPTRWAFMAQQSIVGTPALVDLDRDGFRDVVFATEAGIISVLSGRSGRPMWQHNAAAVTYAPPAIADLDGDGAAEVVIATATGSVLAFAGLTGRQLWSAVLPGNIHSQPAVQDMDADGRLEVLLAVGDGSTRVLAGSTGRELWRVVGMEGSSFSPPLVADLDRDGRLDVVQASYSGQLTAHSGRTRKVLWSHDTGAVLRAAATRADLDQDGVVDVIIGDMLGNLHALSGRSGQALWRSPIGGQIWSPALVADLDLDGRPDVVCEGRKRGLFAVSGVDGRRLWESASEADIASLQLAFLDDDPVPQIVAWSADEDLRVHSGRTGLVLGLVRAYHSSFTAAPVLMDLDVSPGNSAITWRTGRLEPPAGARRGAASRRLGVIEVAAGGVVLERQIDWPPARGAVRISSQWSDSRRTAGR